MELWLPVLAEFWFRKATQLSGGKDEEAAFLFQKVRVRRLYDPLTQDQPVMVDFTKFGRAIFAKGVVFFWFFIIDKSRSMLQKIDRQLYLSTALH